VTRICTSFAVLLILFSEPSLAGEELSQQIVIEAGDSVLVIRPQTVAEAYRYLVDTINQSDFFRENNYEVALPANESFKHRGRIGSLDSFASQVYQPSDYEAAMNSLQSKRGVLRRTLLWFVENRRIESLCVPQKYTVLLTLYGPGGSYNAETGTITMLTSLDGRFRGGGAAENVSHEMMHIAVERTLVQRFNLMHWEKERLVDVLVHRELGEWLPEYQIQQNGVVAMGEAIEGVVLSDLVEAVSTYKGSSNR